MLTREQQIPLQLGQRQAAPVNVLREPLCLIATRNRADGPWGAEKVSVQAKCVGPKSVTTGRLNAAAKWRGPLSVVTSREQRRTRAFDKPSDNGGPESWGAV